MEKRAIDCLFSVIMVFYLPVTVGGYFVYGDLVEPNIAASVSKTTIVTAANVLMAVHLILAFLIVINPVCQELEEIFDVPHSKLYFANFGFPLHICIYF